MYNKITPKNALAKLANFTDKNEISEFISSNFGGNDNRFIRQQIAELLTGNKIPLVKCGISHLTEYFLEWKKQQVPAVAEPTNETNFDSLVGAKVKRTCGRSGVIKSHVNGKLTIELEDGSVRKPNTKRFSSFYKMAE